MLEAMKDNLLLATVLHHGNWKENRSVTSYNLPLPYFFFFFPSSPTPTVRRCRPAEVGSPAETLPTCGAEGLRPSHLNLAGLTWNSLPVGLPQTLALSQAGGPRCQPQQLMSDTPPVNSLQPTAHRGRRKRFFNQLLPVELVELLAFNYF